MDIKTYNRLVVRICTSLDFMGGLALTAMFMLIAAHVVLRMVGRPIIVTHELVQLLMVSSVGLTIANCALRDAHPSLGMLVNRMPPSLRTVIAIAVNILVLGFTLVASWRMLQHGLGFIASRHVGMVSQIPFYPFAFILSLGFLIYAMVAVNNILQIVGGGKE